MELKHFNFTSDERIKYNALKSAESRRLFLQGFFKKNFEEFVWLLGFRDLGSFHKEQIRVLSQVRFLNDSPTRRLWLWSRGFFKTSLITEAHSVWLIVNNPNIRLLLVSNTVTVAESMLRNIKNQFMSNTDFRYFFKEYCPSVNTVGKIEFGSVQDFTIPCRSIMRKEPTMMVAGVGTSITGMHYDYMKIDDLVTKDSVTNDTQIQASKDYYASLRHLYDKAAVPREDVVGTIYHFNDLYYSVLKPIAKVGEIKESFIPARIEGKATFFERLNDEALEKLISDPSVGPYQYQTQYMLNPVNPADAKFKSDWLKEYDAIPEGLAEYIHVDPASTQKKKSDYTVLERWGVDSCGKRYLLEGIRDKFTIFERIDALFGMVSRARRLKWVTYEVLGGRHGDLESIKQKQQETGNFFIVKETKATSASKIDRIEQRLVGQYHAGNILLPRTLYFKSKFDGKTQDFVQLLKLEYLQFPFTEHDDILDCQAQGFEEQIIRGEKIVPRETKSGMTADDWDRMYDEMEGLRKRYKNLDNEQFNNLMAANRLRNIARRAGV